MESGELAARAWAPGTDFPAPDKLNWMYHLGLSIICIMWTLSLIVIVLRIWTRWTAKQLGIDDALIVAAMVVNTAWFYALVMYVKTSYVGIHYWDAPTLDLDHQSTAKLYEWLIILLYHPVLGFVKASVLCFHEKLTGIKRSIRYAVYALQAVNAGSMIAIFCTSLFQCDPISLNWEPGYKRSCINNLAFNYAYNSIVIATDVAVLAVPFWAFLGLQMRTRLKIAVLGVFALGLIVTVISCVRLAILVTWLNAFYAGNGTKDIYYDLGWVASPIESNLAIVAASMPALWPLFRRCFPGVFSTAGPSYYVGPEPYASNRATAGFLSNARRSMRVTDGDGDTDDGFMMKSMQAGAQADYRPSTPAGSQDGIINCGNGIVRTTDIDVSYETNPKGKESTDDGEADVTKKSGICHVG